MKAIDCRVAPTVFTIRNARLGHILHLWTGSSEAHLPTLPGHRLVSLLECYPIKGKICRIPTPSKYTLAGVPQAAVRIIFP
jgi:hypothetical protein